MLRVAVGRHSGAQQPPAAAARIGAGAIRQLIRPKTISIAWKARTLRISNESDQVLDVALQHLLVEPADGMVLEVL
jgi:hypothetical protein